MARAKAGQSTPARDDVRETAAADAAFSGRQGSRARAARRPAGASQPATRRARREPAGHLRRRPRRRRARRPRRLHPQSQSRRPRADRARRRAPAPRRPARHAGHRSPPPRLPIAGGRRLPRRVRRPCNWKIQGLRGRRRWIEIHATPLPGDDGDVSALVCVSRDITARRRRRRRYAIVKRNGAACSGRR